MIDKLNDCGCCAGLSALTPTRVENRPGLTAIAYRAGTHAQFQQSMLAGLSRADRVALRDLTTRDDDDFSIALLDAAATVADVLTFYQERIANESYLRTATERRSVLELARLIGYEPSAGVAANTWLAFTLDETPGAPAEITIDAGARVQSIPGPGEQPQIFETAEPIKARPEWNVLRPVQTKQQQLGKDAESAYLTGVNTGLKVGDSLLFIYDKGWAVSRVSSVDPDATAGRTLVKWNGKLAWSELPKRIKFEKTDICIYALTQRAGLFGHNAPDRRVVSDSVNASYLTTQGLVGEYFQDTGDGANRKYFSEHKLTRVDSTIKFDWGWAKPHPDLEADRFSVRWKGWIKTRAAGAYEFSTVSDDGVRLWINGQLMIENWNVHSATTDKSSPLWLDAERFYPICLEYYEQEHWAQLVLSWSGPGWTTETIPAEHLYTVPDEWPDLTVSAIAGQGLYGQYFAGCNLEELRAARIDSQVNFNWQSGSPDSSVSADNFSVRWTGWLRTRVAADYTFYITADDGVRLWIGDLDKALMDYWSVQTLTEHQASLHLEGGRLYPIMLEYFEQSGLAQVSLSWSSPQWIKEIIPADRLAPPQIYLDALYPQIQSGLWTMLSSPDRHDLYQVQDAVADARSRFTLSAKTTRLTLTGENLQYFDNKVRQTVVLVQNGDALPLARIPDQQAVTGDSIVINGTIDGLAKGRSLVVSGKDVAGKIQAESVQVVEVTGNGKDATIKLSPRLQYEYDRATVTINANVVPATHGETREEVLGSGDVSQPYQRFTLRQPPLTYVTTSTGNGAESTLKIYVNDILWHEVPTLYGHGSKERIYVTQRDNDGKTSVQFGDGQTGARLPTGQENVRAVYRSGIGTVGNLKVNQLSLPMSRPLGVRSVTNPLAAKDGAEAESHAEIRRNAPLKVLTLDRAVSLRDYEDYASAFTGIAKAQATWIWDGHQRCVCLTVAGPGGKEPVTPERIKDLLEALRSAGDPYIVVQAQNCRIVRFGISAKIKVKPDYAPEKVLNSVKQALDAAFSFDVRSFGQPVTTSEVMEVIHTVPGVTAVDVDKVERIPEPVGIQEPIRMLPILNVKAILAAQVQNSTPKAPSTLLMKTSPLAIPSSISHQMALISVQPQLALQLARLRVPRPEPMTLTAEHTRLGDNGQLLAAELLLLDLYFLELTEMS